MSEPDTAALAFDDVSAARGGRLIWSEATFEVPPGGIVAVIGSNGAGKTTLLQIMLGSSRRPPVTSRSSGSRRER